MAVLCVGLSCLDVIQVCKDFPIEDTDQRSIQCRLQRGGNASNTSTVLSILGLQTEYLGTFASGPLCQYIKEDFAKYDINTSNCKIYDDFECPLSSILLNSKNGSRTIIHSNRNLPELSFSEFSKINLDNYSWIHFEGRNVQEVKKMMQAISKYNKERNNRITVSVELERPVWDLIDLVLSADVIVVGKDFSMKFGWPDMKTTLTEMRKYIKQSSLLVSTWGEKGAALSNLEETVYVSAYSPERVVDTLGAGDTFLAGLIYSLQCQHSPHKAVDFACRLAGFKVGILGYNDLKQMP